MAVSVPIME